MRKHELLKKFITGLAKGHANSLIVLSKAGCGKTATTFATMDELGYVEGEHYLYLSNYATPLSFYELLQDVNNLKEPKLLILDDVEEILKNQRIVSMLKGGLWEANGKRRVCWLSTSNRGIIPEFDFEGRIIFLLNSLNEKNASVFAFKDRGFYFEINLNKDEMLELMDERVKKEYKNIPFVKRREIFEFLKKVGRVESMTLRLLPKAYNAFLISPHHYKELILEII